MITNLTKSVYKLLYPSNMFTGGCSHDYVPAYWRSPSPSYKRCRKCGDVKTGSKDEQIKWANKSPWKDS